MNISTDPGRFVCNYTYFLGQEQALGTPSKYCLFLHVPLFEKIDEREQFDFLTELISCLAH